ncbi:BH0509 family protein [Bacillus sp. FJAT-49732]|uniref:BH0509 family protein n=1 Tax=Lederbergia citrisecunda TaxID=2833583 RepID=A0A942TJ69_9BACI|nr:BH0509 family protein [Lederbergia citrisecunda]MBS4198595.1 BH0509 family protein [Lederbergia citrisecunda]
MNQDVIDREQMIFQIMLNTKFTEKALEKMTDKELEELYRLKVEKRH